MALDKTQATALFVDALEDAGLLGPGDREANEANSVHIFAAIIEHLIDAGVITVTIPAGVEVEDAGGTLIGTTRAGHTATGGIE